MEKHEKELYENALQMVDELQKEIENLTNSAIQLNEILKEKQQIIDKAIEYIEDNKKLSLFADCREPEEEWSYDLECSANELLEILKGEDKE